METVLNYCIKGTLKKTEIEFVVINGEGKKKT